MRSGRTSPRARRAARAPRRRGTRRRRAPSRAAPAARAAYGERLLRRRPRRSRSYRTAPPRRLRSPRFAGRGAVCNPTTRPPHRRHAHIAQRRRPRARYQRVRFRVPGRPLRAGDRGDRRPRRGGRARHRPRGDPRGGVRPRGRRARDRRRQHGRDERRRPRRRRLRRPPRAQLRPRRRATARLPARPRARRALHRHARRRRAVEPGRAAGRPRASGLGRGRLRDRLARPRRGGDRRRVPPRRRPRLRRARATAHRQPRDGHVERVSGDARRSDRDRSPGAGPVPDVRAAHRRARPRVPGGRTADHDAEADGGDQQEGPQRAVRAALRAGRRRHVGAGARPPVSVAPALRARIAPALPALRVARFVLAVGLVVAMGVIAVRDVSFESVTWWLLVPALLPIAVWWLLLARGWSLLAAGRTTRGEMGLWCRTQVLRYLPGGIWAPTSRVALVGGSAVDRLATVAAENVASLAAALALGGLAMAASGRPAWGALVLVLFVPVAGVRLARGRTRLDGPRARRATVNALPAFASYLAAAVLVHAGGSGAHHLMLG